MYSRPMRSPSVAAMFVGPTTALALALPLALAVTGCVRGPAPALCPDIGTGDLVVTEFRGVQNPEDLLGPWVEIYNASGAVVDLEGLKIRFRRKDGSSEVPIIVRRSVIVAAGAYTVLGMVDDEANRPTHIDYGFLNDFQVTFLSAAAVDVERCGLLVDRAVYDVLPKTGTFSLGTTPPDSTSNDIPAQWCVNPISSGTPQQPNPICP